MADERSIRFGVGIVAFVCTGLVAAALIRDGHGWTDWFAPAFIALLGLALAIQNRPMTFTPAPKPRRSRKAAVRKPLPPRSSGIARSGKPKTNAKRQAKRLARTHGPVEFREWIKTQPCASCGVVGYSVNAHIGKDGKGTSRKANWDQVAPLCCSRFVSWAWTEGCHEAFDAHTLTINVPRLLAATQTNWQSHQSHGTPT